MRIAVVLNTSWNIYNFRMNFVKSLLTQGYEVHTIAPQDDFVPYLTEAGCIHHPVRMDSRGVNPIKDTGLIFELMSIYRRVKPDIVLHYTIKPNVYGTIAATMLGIPVINNVCGLGTVFLKKNLLSSIALALYKISFRFPRKVFFQNQEDMNLFIEKKLVKKGVVDLVPGSGIDLTKFTPFDFKRNNRFTFLLISRLITDKGILEYVAAVEKLKREGVDARFQLLGAIDEEHKRGIPREQIEGWINNGTIEYLGTTNDVRAFIKEADCVVLPSYREGTPRTLLEAASSAKPMIATNVPGCNNVVEDNVNGLLCRMKDADDLAEKMRIMAGLKDETLRTFGLNARSKIEAQFDEGIVINKYLAALSAIRQAS